MMGLPVQVKTIQEEWEGFAAMVFRGMTPTETQEREMKKSFFAGAWMMFTAMERMGEDDVTEPEAFRLFNTYRRECLEFQRQITKAYSETN